MTYKPCATCGHTKFRHLPAGMGGPICLDCLGPAMAHEYKAEQ